MIYISSLKKTLSDKFELLIDELIIQKGEIIALIGNNGSGKTLLLNAILNNIYLSSGVIKINDLNHNDERWKLNTGIYMNQNYLLDFMTPIEYWKFVGSFYKINSKKIFNYVDSYKEFLGEDINSIINKKIAILSQGLRDKIGIIAALIHEPELLIFDEPFSHLDRPSIERFTKILKIKNAQFGTTQIISGPDINYLISICTRFICLENGGIKFNLINNEINVTTIKDYYST